MDQIEQKENQEGQEKLENQEKKSYTKFYIVGVLVILIAGGLFFLKGGGTLLNSKSEGNLDKAPGFSLVSNDGIEVALEDSKGKVRIVNAWATWCPFCVDELPDFARAQEEFRDELVVIAINRAESEAQARKFTDEFGITDKITFLLDPEDSFYKSIGGFSMPETLFIDGDGNIVIHKRGPMKYEEIKEKVESILNQEK